MDNKKHNVSKVLTLIPVFALAVTVASLVMATILEGPTSRGTVYTIFAMILVLNLFISPLPCLVMSIAGTVFAALAVKEGSRRTIKFLVLGITDIVAYVVGVILACLMFTGAMSV